MASTGELVAGSVAETAAGTAWTNLANTRLVDGSYGGTTLDANTPPPEFTKSLVLYNFGAGAIIPAGAAIDGIKVRLTRQSGAATGDAVVKDIEVYIRLATAVNGTNKADTATAWGGLETILYGSAIDQWGHALTRALVIKTNFGIAFRAVGAGTSGHCSFDFDGGTMEIFFTPAGPVGSSCRLLRGVGV